jgi:hypothetical protein
VSAYAWLALALAAGAAAYFVGSSALTRNRQRRELEDNEARYRAWRGRAAPAAPPPQRGLTGAERRLALAAMALVAVSLACLVAFFAAT